MKKILKRLFGYKEKQNKQSVSQNDAESQVDNVIRNLNFQNRIQSSISKHDSSLEYDIKETVYDTMNFLDEDEKKQIFQLKKLSNEIESRLNFETPIPEFSNSNIDFENELNENQLKAVYSINNPLLVIAGAGSGKTRIITYKVAYLIEIGIEASEILLLTFTRKSADEMLDRVQTILNDKKIGNVLGGTFHSFSNYVLRRFGNLNSIDPTFSIIDTSDTEDIIDLMKSELKIKSKVEGKQFPKKSKVQKILSKSKNIETNINKTIDKYFKECSDFKSEINLIDIAVQKYKKASNLFDYDDLMIILRNCLRDSKQFRTALQKSIKYILVDEYQDTNNIQREIVYYLAEKNQQITVVGDDSQSIYAFRGANFENILRFPSSFEKCDVIKLEQNYRSQKGILDFTNDIIDSAKIGFKKKLFTSKKELIKPIIKKFHDSISEAEFIADKIIELKNNEIEYSDFAVLTRASWHSSFIQAELTKRGIPFVVVGGIKFSERRHIKDIIAFLKILVNPLDAIAWHRCLRLVEGIGKVRASEIIKVIHQNNGLIDFSKFSKRKYFDEINKMGFLLSKLRNEEIPPILITDQIIEYYKPLLENLEDDYKSREQDLEIIKTISQKYETLEKFLSEFTLEPPSNKFQDDNTPSLKEDVKPVTLSTIHSAKGLEWYSVFIPFVLDGLIPSSRSLGSVREIEEERRLFYVATSRAKKNLFLTMPSYVSSWDAVFTKPSRFLKSIKRENYEIDI